MIQILAYEDHVVVIGRSLPCAEEAFQTLDVKYPVKPRRQWMKARKIPHHLNEVKTIIMIFRRKRQVPRQQHSVITVSG